MQRLAQRHRLGSGEFAEGTTFGGGVDDGLSFTVGEASFAVDLSDATDLAGVRDAIVDAAAGALDASIVTTDDGSQALVLNARDTGEANAVTIAYEGALTSGTFGFATLNTDPDGAALGGLDELDAQLEVDGFTVTRATNRVTDVLEGVTLDLRVADANARVEVAVTSDVGTLSQRMGTVVERYNALLGTIEELTAFGGEDGPSGALIGDATLRALQSRVRDAIGVGTEATTELGISSGDDGRLQFDSGAFVTRLTENPTAVVAAVAGEDGLATRLAAQVEVYADGSDGLIKARTDGLDARLEDISEQREALATRLEALERRYIDQFTALDGLIAQFNTTGSFLAQQLANLPGPGGDDG